MKTIINVAYLLVFFIVPISEGYAQKDIRLQSKDAVTDQQVVSIKSSTPLSLSVGKSTILPIEGILTRVSVANPEVIDVTVIRSRELYVLGKKTGTTNIFLWNNAGQMTIRDVVVGADTVGLESKLRELMPNETQIKVSSAGDALVLLGQVSDAAKVQRAVLLAEQYTGKKIINFLGTGDVPQVLLEVKVAEVSKKLTDKLGASISAGGSRGSFTYSLLGGFLTGGVLSSPAGSTGAGISLGRGNETIKLEAEIKNGLIKVLAEPNIMAVSGQEGSFLAGGKIFIPVPQSSSGGASTITLEEREYGVGLKFLPTVLEGGKINLRVTPEVSELALEGTTVKSGSNTTVLPTISTRRASTTVQLMDGQSFAIGGLIKNNVTETITGFPFLSEIPILGTLFRSSEFINDRSELMFLVTPRLVKPLSQTVALPTDRFVPPTRSEFLFEGKLEGKSDSKLDTKPAPQPDVKPNSRPDNRSDVDSENTTSGKEGSSTNETVESRPYRETGLDLLGEVQPVETMQEAAYSNANGVTILPLAGNDLIIDNTWKATNE
ncbi:MAG: type II and III secretion system protein family protein [Oligoflexus sp.]|jgi:pilus assembly protein CpaC